MSSSNQESEKRFRVCESCGRLTPAHLPRCVECGQASVKALAEAAEREKEERFARTFFTRGAPATFALIGANVAVFVLLASVAKTVDPGTLSYQAALIAFGAKVNSLINQGEYWRFVTPMFLHVGAIHLLVNMYSLYAIGPQVERLYGTSRFLLIYLLSGVAGVAASYAFPSNAGVPSAGASGALFGLLGALLVFGFRFRSELPGVFRRAFSPRGLVPVLVLNLFITFAIPVIDKGAHLGGLAAGAALAAVIPYFRTSERRAGLLWRALATLAVVATVACFALAFRSYRPISTTGNRFIEVYNDTQKADQDAFQAARDAADGQAVPPDAAEKARAAARDLRSGAGVDDASEALFRREADQLDRIAALLERKGQRPSAGEVQAIVDDEKKIDEEWTAWLDSSGADLGIVRKQDNPGGDDGN